MSAFVNYVADDGRASPINLAVVRVLLGMYVIWRVLSLEWAAYGEWPNFHVDETIGFLHQDLFFALLPYQQWVVAALLVLFVVGYRTRWTGGLASLLLMHMLSVKATIYLAGTVESLFVCSYLILMFALFAEDDRLSIDALRRSRDRSLEELNAVLTDRTDRVYRMRALKWGLLAVAIIYVGSAWGKALNGPLEIWLSGAELQRDVLFYGELTGIDRAAGVPIVENELLAWVGFVGTALVQVSLLVAAVIGLSVTLPILGIIGFHVSVILTLGLYFIDMILVLSLFAAWDLAYRRLAADADDEATVVYDDRCHACARALVPFAHLDGTDSVRFVPRSDAPAELADRDAALILSDDGETAEGYEAFRRLIGQFRLLAPITWVMGVSPLRGVGTRAYDRVVSDRRRYRSDAPEPGGS
ncbi:DCC1-like thiol-disulfide oxidoreductase family protein [Natronococcus sp. A-GB1]|uniref:DCC1-like thiol-disulfide oxidoreductase family protein n=1 Tax=Natronococcus sp. A-GB1 TaxID=3037648 RepID=UPI00241C7994|nr:DCC1-like thiol-disulfide oxidoreductase family protein [Natronococcus sp. A-GB1]MDG5758445.1 DCC1-like thiol-disulfide oxidoreductase family protein [Natronococcus sp. A-GB1]